MFRHALFLLGALVVLPACQETRVVAVKEFRIYADTDSETLQHAIRVLARRYNQQMGSEALTIVDTPAESNSRIQFTEGLHDNGQKLGLGQWMTSTRQSSSVSLQGEKNTETVLYAMKIEFDAGNFEAKAPEIDDSSSDEAIHLFHLFSHEVGHGLQMEHSKDITSVMYPTIPDQPTRYVDYKSYFNRARSFMSGH